MPAPGTRIGSYEVVALIGKGGMGEVWRARDLDLGRDVALKFIDQPDADRRARFEREARTLAALNHPNICAVYSIGPDFIAMELVEGAPLAPDGRRSLRAVLDIAVQIADGLAAAHSSGIVHRDLKPDNVLVTRDGRVKIVDLGLAKSLGAAGVADVETGAPGHTRPGTILGTVAFMSPEQARGDAEIDTRSDQFSFGLILYELLAGKRAFKRDTAAETLAAIIREDPAPLPATVPAPLRWVVERCLAKERERRYDSTRDLYLELTELRDRVAELGGLLPSSSRASSRLRAALSLAALVTLAGTTGYGIRACTSSQLSLSAPVYHRLTFRKGAIRQAFFNPDGRWVIYSAQWDGEPSRWYRLERATGDTTSIDVPPDTDIVDVSAQGNLALLTIAPGTGAGTLSQRPLSGGAPRELLHQVQAASFGPDGRLAVVRRTATGARIEYPVGTVLHDAEGVFIDLDVSPDGRRVAATTWSPTGTAILFVSTDRAVATIPIRGNAVPSLSWSSDSREAWLSSVDPSEPGVIRAYAPDGTTRAVTGLVDAVSLVDISAGGAALFRSETGRSAIAMHSAAGTRDLAWLGRAMMPVISGDGRRVVFSELAQGGETDARVYLRPIDGSPPVQLGAGIAHALTADGRWVGVIRGTRNFIVPTGAGEERALPPGDSLVGGLPDGTFVLAHAEPSSSSRCDVWNPVTGARREMTADGCDEAVLSEEATRLIYRGKGHTWHWRLLSDAAPRLAAGLTESDSVLRWQRRGPWVYTLARPDAREFSSVNIETGQRLAWKAIDPALDAEAPMSNRHVSIAPDGDTWANVVFHANSALYVADSLR